ncbi:MAG: putative ABC transporter permease [Clostridiales bacterium]
MYKKFKEYYLYFMMYAVIGWLYEVLLEVVIYRWEFTNRGFLFGPYCPIYGFGAITFILCFNRLIKKKNSSLFKFLKPLMIFFGCMVVATTIEFITSYIMELFTGSWPWQTYSDYKINFQGRIALSPSIRFGIGGVVFLYLIQPLFERIVNKMNSKIVTRVFYGVLIIFSIDFIVRITKLLFLDT